jgi:hypothetical protein
MKALTAAIVAATCAIACDRVTSAPTASSSAPLSAGPVALFSVSGMVREYRGGPLADVLITARPNFPPGNGIKSVHSDGDGYYRIDGLTEAISIDAERPGYFPTGFGAFVGERVVNLTMTRRTDLGPDQTLAATIWGDSTLSGEDDTGSNCGVHDAQGVHSNGCLAIPVSLPGAGTLTARLAWSGPGTEMGVFMMTALYTGQAAHGSSPLSVSADVHGGTLIVISLERFAGARPVPASASQMFELTTSFVAR